MGRWTTVIFWSGLAEQRRDNSCSPANRASGGSIEQSVSSPRHGVLQCAARSRHLPRATIRGPSRIAPWLPWPPASCRHARAPAMARSGHSSGCRARADRRARDVDWQAAALGSAGRHPRARTRRGAAASSPAARRVPDARRHRGGDRDRMHSRRPTAQRRSARQGECRHDDQRVERHDATTTSHLNSRTTRPKTAGQPAGNVAEAG